MWYSRYFENIFDDYVQPGAVLLIYGPRRVGKTSLIENYLKSYKGKYFWGTGEEIELDEILSSQNIARITNTFQAYDLVVIDEAQHIPKIGLGLKMLVDHNKTIKVIASGSSSFDLSNRLGEPLTGRHQLMTLYPVSMLELNEQLGPMEIVRRLDEFLVFGTYPDVLNLAGPKDKIQYLNTLRNSYLLKDLLILENIKNSSKLTNLLRLLAFQIGKEVSMSELGTSLEMSKHTIMRYLDLLEKVFIIKRVGGFSRNLRKEVVKTSRYYFWDNGIRNAIIGNFNPLAQRDDVGQLWENFLFIERQKRNDYTQHYTNSYFWRTYDRQEIDYIEEYGGELHGYEFKWGNKSVRPPKIWLNTYKNSFFNVINKENYLEFLKKPG